MKKKLLYLLSLALLAACSAPKYSYNFDHYNYNAGKKKSAVSNENVVLQGPETVQSTELIASKELTPVLFEDNMKTTAVLTEAQNNLSKKYNAMSKAEKKEFRKELKQSVKTYAKAMKRGDHVAAEKAVQAMDHDLKLAIIFGAVGLTLTLFGGVNSVFWILGVIAFVVGVVFFIKWVVRQ